MLSPLNLLAAADEHVSLAAQRTRWTDLVQAEQVNLAIANLRNARGERTLGYKIGFTNRNIWPTYGVFAPIWSPVYDSTVEQSDAGRFEVAASHFVEPRIEPEIVLGLGQTPASSGLDDVISAIGWYAHGFEVVQSVYPNWKFSAAEAMAAQALHGALFIGRKWPLRDLDDPVNALSRLQLTLSLHDQEIATGRGENVLDGPIHALAYLVLELERRQIRLQPDSIITTGTLTDAQPMVAGQVWHSRFAPAASPAHPIKGIELHVR